MRVLLIDQEGMGLDFALRCIEQGHDVRWFKYADKGKITRDGEGFKGLKIVDDWRPLMPWAKDGLIITTGNFKFMDELDRYREHGYKIFSPTKKSAELEIKRGVGMKAMEAAGIEIPPYQTFNSLEDAERFARKSDDCWVFKTMGDEDDKSLSYVSCDPADMVGWIQQKIKRGMKLRGPCMLQQKIDMLAELGVSGWFGPEGFLPNKWQACFEFKKLMAGEKGPATGEMGTVCAYYDKDRIADEILKPMTPVLAALGHRGDFAVGSGVDTKGRVWPFEFTCRAGWPAFWIQTASHKGDHAQWMRDLLDGKDSLKVSTDVAIGVVIGIPRFPYQCSTPEMVEGNPIQVDPKVEDSVHPASMMIGKGPAWKAGKIVEGPAYQTSGEYVMCVTGLGSTVEKARDKVYSNVKGVKLPNAIYRTDIGTSLEESLPKLRGFGYCKNISFR